MCVLVIVLEWPIFLLHYSSDIRYNLYIKDTGIESRPFCHIYILVFFISPSRSERRKASFALLQLVLQLVWDS
jgi:hypothetical protein